MAYRIAAVKPEIAPSKQTKPVKRKPYRDWIRTLPCVVTGTYPADAAHISTANYSVGHLGRGKSQKASDRWCVPLSPSEHRKQHAGSETLFWQMRGIDPYIIALSLYGLYCDLGPDATDIATQIILGRKVGR